ncbi:MAG: hypothetical protein RL204_125 [Bacteroidota bacterium]|jgi:hypothetical protein
MRLTLTLFVIILLGCSSLRRSEDIGYAKNKEQISAFYEERKAWDFVKSDSIWNDLQSEDSLLIIELIENRRFYSENKWVWFSRNKNFFLQEISDPRRYVVYTICLLFYGNPDYFECYPKWVDNSFNEKHDFDQIWEAIDKWKVEMQACGLDSMRNQGKDPLYYSNQKLMKVDNEVSFD